MMRAAGSTRVPLRIDPVELFRWECEPVPPGIPDSRKSRKFRNCYDYLCVKLVGFIKLQCFHTCYNTNIEW